MHLASAAAGAAPKSVFISYSRADLDEVRPLAQALRRTGLKTWLDLDDLRPGERWKQAIGAALARSDAMVFCVSSLSLESAWTSVELNRAIDLRLPVVPVAVQAIDPAVLPPTLRDLQVCDMSRHPPRHAATLTAREIAMVLGWPVPPAVVAGLPPSTHAAPTLLVGLHAAVWPGGPWRMADAAGVPQAGFQAAVASPHGTEVEFLDLSQSDRIRLADLGDWALQAREVCLAVGPGADAGLVGLVLGRLTQAFGVRRTRLCWCDEGGVPEGLTLLAQVAGVPLARAERRSPDRI